MLPLLQRWSMMLVFRATECLVQPRGGGFTPLALAARAGHMTWPGLRQNKLVQKVYTNPNLQLLYQPSFQVSDHLATIPLYRYGYIMYILEILMKPECLQTHEQRKNGSAVWIVCCTSLSSRFWKVTCQGWANIWYWMGVRKDLLRLQFVAGIQRV